VILNNAPQRKEKVSPWHGPTLFESCVLFARLSVTSRFMDNPTLSRNAKEV
jgi:hypothetical protein